MGGTTVRHCKSLSDSPNISKLRYLYIGDYCLIGPPSYRMLMETRYDSPVSFLVLD